MLLRTTPRTKSSSAVRQKRFDTADAERDTRLRTRSWGYPALGAIEEIVKRVHAPSARQRHDV
jgi:hypothetical protein